MRGENVMKGWYRLKFSQTVKAAALTLSTLLIPLSLNAAVIEDIRFAALPGDSFEVILDFSDVPPEPRGYSIEQPARIVLDLPGVESALAQKKHALSFENAKSAIVLSADDKTRLVINLQQPASYDYRIEGNSLAIVVSGHGESIVKSVNASNAASTSRSATGGANEIASLDFNRGEAGEGIVTIGLTNSSTSVDINQQGANIVVKMFRTNLPEALDRRLDVMDFATPIKEIDTTSDGATTTVKISAMGEFDYLAYQADNTYVVSVKPLTPAEQEERQAKFAYVGEKLSLNFQDIEVRSVLQLIADFTQLNLVASDTVSGNITLRLENVPWDQALDIVLKAKGLDKRQEGNVLMVAPAAEIAERERLQVEANKQLQELAPLRTEFIRVRYADARELFELFNVKENTSGRSSGNATSSILSERGSAIVDTRTNTIILTDTEDKILEFKRLIKEIDIPVQQVLIEARIVIADTDFRKEIGARWGIQGAERDGIRNYGYGGSLEQFADPNNPIQIFNENDPAAKILVNKDALNVDLGVTNPAGRIALEFLNADTFIDLELSALEEDGGGEIISQPKVLTGDKRKAVIKAGTEVAYQEATSSGATSVEFKEAVLKLEVTPQITPDNRVILDLLISQDALGQFTPLGEPTIDTTEIETQALVGDGQTLVLGGIFQNQTRNEVQKVPLLGDIPVVGTLFRHKLKDIQKREILIFITPKIVHDSLID